MIDLAKLQADVARAVSDLPGQVAYKGQSVNVSLSPVNKSDDVADEGALNESDLEAVGVLPDFALRPSVRDIVEVIEYVGATPKKYFVDRVTRDESALHLFLRRA